MLRAVIIDDIENIRKKNSAIIKMNCPSVTLIGEADSVESGVKLIKQLHFLYSPYLLIVVESVRLERKSTD